MAVDVKDWHIPTLELIFPLSKAHKVLDTFAEFLGEPRHRFQAHLLKDNTVYIMVNFDPAVENDLLVMDRLSSSAIRYGGTLRA